MNMKLFGALITLVIAGLLVAGYLLFKDTEADKQKAPGQTQGTTAHDPNSTTTETPVITPDVKSNGGGEPTRVTQQGDNVFSARGQLIVKGVVRSKADHAPLGDVEVSVHDEDGDAMESAKSGKDGVYSVTVNGEVPRKIEVTTAIEGYASEIAVGDVVAGEHREMTFDFELSPEFYIEGHVTNAASGAGIAEAQVSVRCGVKAFNGETDDATTDIAGYYKIGPISALPREGFDVYTEPDEFAPMVKYDLKVDANKSTVTVDFAVFSGLKLTGIVVGKADQKPIAEAIVNGVSPDIEFADLGENDVTGEDGRFTLELESTPYDRMFVMVTADNHGPVIIEKLPTPANDGTIDLGRIELPDQTTVSGTVYNKRTGLPVTAGDVKIYCANAPDDLDNDTESIDANGHFEMKLAYTTPGRAMIEIDAADCALLQQPLKLDPNAPVQSPLRFEVEPLVVMRGKVTNKTSGAPVIGAVVQLTPAGQEGRRRVVRVAAADGSYKIDLPPDTKFDATDVIIKFQGKSFNMGPVPTPAEGGFELSKDFAIDVPATSTLPAPPPRPMRPKQ